MITADWWMWVYLALAIASAACALASRSFALTYAAATMLVSWAVSNGVFGALDRSAFPRVVPEVDALLAIGVVYVGRWKNSLPLATVFGLFIFELSIHALSILVNVTGKPCYYIALNAIFAAQCITIGAAGVCQTRLAPRTAWRRPGFVDLARIGREVGSRLADVAAGRKDASQALGGKLL